MAGHHEGKPGLRSRLAALWRGEVPLGEAFWLYAMVLGTIVNLLASLLFILMNALELPDLLATATFFLPVPYNAFAAVVVWRSAGRYTGPPHWAQLARLVVTVWALIASFS